MQDLTRLVVDEREYGVLAKFALPVALWLAHLSATGVVRPLTASQYGSDLMESYSTAARVVDEAGGVPRPMLHNPPIYINVDEPEYWLEAVGGKDQTSLPSWQNLNERHLFNPSSEQGRRDYSRVVLLAMTSDEWTRWEGQQVCLGLRGP